MLPNLKDFICLMTYSLPFSYNDFTNSIWTTCWPSVRNRSALRLEGLPSIDCIDFGIRNSQNHKWQSTSLHDDFVAYSPALSKTAMTILLDLPHGSKRNGMISTSSRRSKLQSSPILWCSNKNIESNAPSGEHFPARTLKESSSLLLKGIEKKRERSFCFKRLL